MKLGILNEFLNSHTHFVNACEELNIDYEVIDFISDEWLTNIINAKCDGLLVRPSYAKAVWKTMYDEKLYFIVNHLKIPIYPSYDELYIYENKRNMSYWLKSKGFSHPMTMVFYDKKEANKFLDNYNNFPIVFKTNIGSAAIGVEIIEKKRARKLVNRVFTKYRFVNFGYTKWKKFRSFVKIPMMDDRQYNNIIFQEKIDVKTEWRMVVIGESYFGHQKLLKNGFHSGSNEVGWVNPPKKLLDFTKEIIDKGSFRSMALDIFEDFNGNYYVNELQSHFGSYHPTQMYVDDIPGRYIYKDKEWKFEEGFFNRYSSTILRVKDFVSILNGKHDV